MTDSSFKKSKVLFVFIFSAFRFPHFPHRRQQPLWRIGTKLVELCYFLINCIVALFNPFEKPIFAFLLF